jgi:hypothetical protein
MKVQFIAVFAVFAVGLAFLYTVPLGHAEDTALSYRLVDQSDGMFSYTLNVVVPSALTDYYAGLNHRSASNKDFPKFVTPYAVKPIAGCMRQIYPDDEDFVNGVLTLVHQIRYEETVPAFYAVETMVRKCGDCDLLSIIAASILKADGMDVVLLRYVDEEHMNIGVHLAAAPKDARLDVYSLESQGVTYYVAECTSSDWQAGWRLGECPDDLKNASVQVISLEGSEQVAPGQVSASFEKLEPTTLALQVEPFVTTAGSEVTLSGQLSPALANENVTLYVNVNWGAWNVLNTTETGTDGSFSYSWASDVTGICGVLASWSGSGQYAGTSSTQVSTVVIIPFFLIAVGVLVVAVVILGVVWLVLSRRRQQKPADSSPVMGFPPPPPDLAAVLVG